MLGKVFGVICILSFIGAMVTGDPVALGNAVLDGASDTVTLTLTLCGMMGLWCGIMRVLESAGLIRRLARMMRPLLRLFFPAASEVEEACGAIAANISANLLGLGNAATPLGIRAAQRMATGCGGPASDELCRLVVLNTASIQLLPTTVAAVRSAQGCAAPLDILPAVWLSSVLSVTAGRLAAGLLQRVWRAGPWLWPPS